MSQLQIPQIDWGPKPSIRTLNTEERRAEIPADVFLEKCSLKGHSGICLGRDKELQGIKDYFRNQWEKEASDGLQQGDCVAYLITNAPGAGKTTVMEELAIQYGEDDIACIRVGAKQLTDDSRLIKRLTDYAAGQDRPEDEENGTEVEQPTQSSRRTGRWFHRAAAHVRNLAGRIGLMKITKLSNLLGRAWRRISRSSTTADVAGTVVGVAATPIAGAIAKASISAGQGMRELFRQRLVEAPPQTAEEALRLLSDTHDGKFIIMVDECQKWMDPDTNRDAVKGNLEVITDPGIRKDERIRGGGAVLAGLGSASDGLDGLGLSRAGVVWLKELQPEPAREIVYLWIMDANISSERKQKLADLWADQLTADFTHWAQHTAAAGYLAKHVLEATEPEPGQEPHSDAQEHQHLEWVRTMTAREIERLYRERWRHSQTHGTTDAAQWITALATLTHNRMPQQAINFIIKLSLRRDQRNADSDKIIRSTITAMKRAGIFRELDPEKGEKGTTILREMALPSLQRFITEDASDEQLREAYRVAHEALNSMNIDNLLAKSGVAPLAPPHGHRAREHAVETGWVRRLFGIFRRK